MTGASETQEKYLKKMRFCRGASDALGVVMVAVLLALLFLDVLDAFRAWGHRKDALLALMACVPLIFIAAFRLSARAQRAHATILLMQFGMAEAEAAAIARDRRGAGLQLEVLAGEYESLHKADIERLEQEFLRLMTDTYRVKPLLAQNILSAPVAGAHMRQAVLWHRTGQTAEDTAARFSRMAGKRDRVE